MGNTVSIDGLADAVMEELTEYNKLAEETMKKALTVDQLRTLLTMPVEPWQEEYRDMFWLMFLLRGINAVDLFGATPDQVVDGRLGVVGNATYRLHVPQGTVAGSASGRSGSGSRAAPSEPFVPQPPAMPDLIEVPEQQPQRIVKPTNWARHTWATLCAELDIPDPTITLGMGHATAGHRTTAIYIKRDRSKVDEANRKVIDHLWGKQ